MALPHRISSNSGCCALAQNLFALFIALSGRVGVSLPWVIPIWGCVLVLMYFLCVRYDHFKHGKDVNSLWHLL